MKKILLSLATAALAFAGMQAAETVTLNVADATNFKGTDQNGYYQPCESFEINGYTFSFTWKDGTTNTVRAGGGEVRIYGSADENTMTITAPSGVKFNTLVFTVPAENRQKVLSPSVGTCQKVPDSFNISWAGTEGVNSVTFSNPETAQMRFTAVEVTLGTGAGTHPGAGEVTPPAETTQVSSLSAALALEAGTEFEFAGEAVVIWASGRYLYAQDASCGALIYGNDWNQKYGDVIKSFKGKADVYNNNPQISSVTDFVVDGTKELTPKDVAKAADADAALNSYVKLSTVKVADKKVTFSDGSTLALYNRFGIEMADGDYAAAYGVIGKYGDTTQFYYISNEPLKVTEKPAATSVGTVAEALALATDTEFVFNGEAVVSWASGKYMFVQDATGAALMYGNDWTQKYGDVIKSFNGKISVYNTNPQFASVTDLVVEGTKELTPVEVANADAAGNYVNYYVKFNDVTAEADQIVFSDNTTLPTYNRFGIEYVVGGEYGEMYGVVGKYGTTVQFYFISDKALALGDEPVVPPTDTHDLVVADATDKEGTATDNGIQPLESFKIGDFTFTFAAGAEASATQNPAFWANDNTLRIYKGATMTVTAPEGQTFKGLVWNCKSIKGVSADNAIVAEPAGDFTYEAKTITWTAAEGVNSVKFTLPDVADANNVNPNVQILSFDLVAYTSVGEMIVNDGVKTVYDLNGRIVNGNELQKGIYIIRENGRSHKVMIK